jgi:hypothetical protein
MKITESFGHCLDIVFLFRGLAIRNNRKPFCHTFIMHGTVLVVHPVPVSEACFRAQNTLLLLLVQVVVQYFFFPRSVWC